MFDDYCVNLPFPVVSGGVSERELDFLYELSVGRFSKMTALTTYLYQSVIFAGDEELYQLFSGIFYCELNHLIKLLHAIVAVGGDPVFAGKNNYFSGSYANYQKQPKNALVDDFNQKEEMIMQLERFLNLTKNQSLCDLASRIIMDEKLHLAIIDEHLKVPKTSC